MTVLMFGWEFPPHISGGLGTACFGLTHALMEEQTDILFVVPRAFGDEDIPVINASDVGIGARHLARFTQRQQHGMTTVHVESGISAYGQHHHRSAIEKWNWAPYAEEVEEAESAASTEKKKFHFSGGYAGNLLVEVELYAEVAKELAAQYRFDIIHAHDWLTYPAGIAAKRISGKPLIIHVHATEFDRAGEKNIDPHVFNIELKGMTEADHIIAVSQWTKEIIMDRYGIDESKISVVHNGVFPADDFDLSFLPKLSDQIVTFLGRVTFQKGPQYFIEAAGKVLQHIPDVHFIMAGSGDLLPAMIERVAQLKLSSRIHFTGFVRGIQVHQVWSVTDLYVMPSVSEPFGITPLEAIQAGVPVIVSNQSGVSEVIEHAIKVDFWDTDALASAMISVLKHRGLSEELRMNSKREVESLTWKRAAKKIKSLYHEITSQ